MAKKKLPPALKAYQECRVREGVQPFKSMSESEKRKVEECVRIKLKK